MNVIYEKSFHFAIRVVKLYRFMTDSKKEFVLSKQLLRSGTSIGANIAEAEKAQSSADFYAKMNIALKEKSSTHTSMGRPLSGILMYGPYPKIVFRLSESLHKFCILHFAFCISTQGVIL